MKLVSADGIEPSTLCLKGRCSTPELRAQKKKHLSSKHFKINFNVIANIIKNFSTKNLLMSMHDLS